MDIVNLTFWMQMYKLLIEMKQNNTWTKNYGITQYTVK